ncbi:hypothetical protein GCM10028819_32080 [Spirosoma humi]
MQKGIFYFTQSKAMDILEVIAKWLFWLFDGIGVNLILKKIGKAFDKKGKDDTDMNTNSLVGPRLPQV